MSIYCKSCGSCTNSGSSIARFCAACGEPFVGSSQSGLPNVTLAKPKQAKANQSIIFVNDEETSEVIPQIEKLEYTVKRGNYQGTKIRDIIGGEPESTGRQSGLKKKPSKKQILEEFKAEASVRGRSNPIEIE